MKKNSIRKDYCVIGYGRFGRSIVKTLVEKGASVVVIDKDRQIINEAAPFVSYSSAIDATNINSLKDIGISRFDHIFVTIGQDIEASIMTCAALVDIEVTSITARASSKNHEMVLRKLGVKEIVRPEKQIGKSEAVKIIRGVSSSISAVGNNLVIIKLKVENSDLYGLNIKKHYLYNDTDAHFIGLERRKKLFFFNDDIIFEKGDEVFIACQNNKIDYVEKSFNNIRE